MNISRKCMHMAKFRRLIARVQESVYYPPLYCASSSMLSIRFLLMFSKDIPSFHPKAKGKQKLNNNK